MKKHLLLTFVLLMGTVVTAQEVDEIEVPEETEEIEETEKSRKWTNEGSIGLNFAQSSFTNWAAGGQSTLNWQGTLYYELRYENGNFEWDNTLNAALGYSYFDFKKKPVKTDDLLEFTSLAGLTATDKLSYSLELAFRSQFAKGYKYSVDSTQYISKFLAPAYVSLGLGMEWIPNEHIFINFAPITGRLTIVNDDYLASIGAFGVNDLDPNDTTIHARTEKVHFEFGARLTAKMVYTLFENVDFMTKLELFSNYLNHPERIDVDWQNLFVLKVNSWLNCNIGTHLIYDYDVPFYDLNPDTGLYVLDENSKVQFKEVLSIGLLFKL